MNGYRPLAALLFLVPACAVETSPTPYEGPGPTAPSRGEVVVTWTIDGAKDPNKCAQSNVSVIQITVTSTSGVPAGTYQQACSAFSTSIPLDRGTYTANATLIAASGAARTTTIAINPFDIRGNDTFNLPIDFPARSFFGPA